MFCVANHQILKKKLKVPQYLLLKNLSCISIFLFFSVFVQAKEIKKINPLALEEHFLNIQALITELISKPHAH